MKDEKITTKLTEEEKKSVNNKVEEIIKWLEASPTADTE